jgi:hypothetical protein
MDDPAPINRLDGFSVASPLAVGFPRAVAATVDGAATTTAVRLLIAQPGATRGSEIGLRLSVVKDTHGEATLLLAYPKRPLAYDTDYVAVVLDELPAADGGRFEAPRAVRVALGLAAPSTDAEAALLAYHAPTRALLADVGIAPERVIRVWDFTTRSAAGVSAPLTAMRARATAAVAAGAVTVVVDSARLFDDQSALEVRGRVEGLPLFAGATGFSLDDNALPTQLGVHAVPFRAVAPAGSGPYPMVVYGHGTGGTVDDDSFDREIVAEGAGKLNLEWAGWTEDTVLSTLLGLQELVSGTERSTARLLQSLADAAALEAALDGALGDALAAPTVAGVANPAAGRRPDPRGLVYAGGSLGGTMGYVHSLVDPGIRHAVLNVPGAGWTHFAPASDLWARISGFLLAVTPSAIDVALGMAMTQSSWDPVDGVERRGAGGRGHRPHRRRGPRGGRRWRDPHGHHAVSRAFDGDERARHPRLRRQGLARRRRRARADRRLPPLGLGRRAAHRPAADLRRTPHPILRLLDRELTRTNTHSVSSFGGGFPFDNHLFQRKLISH